MSLAEWRTHGLERPRRNAARGARALTLAEFVVLVTLFATGVGLVVGPALADLLVPILRHLGSALRPSRAA